VDADNWGWHRILRREEFGSFLYNDTMMIRARVEVVMDSTRGGNGWTALHFASVNGHRKTARLLLLYGAEVNKANADGNTPLHLAANNNRSEVIATLLDAGADVTLRNQSGQAPIHSAALNDASEAVAALLQAAPETVDLPVCIPTLYNGLNDCN